MPGGGHIIRAVQAKSVPFFKASRHLVERMSANTEVADKVLAEQAMPSR